MELRIATCHPLPEPDVDEAPLLAAFAQRGVRARCAAWDDPAEDWDAPVPTLVRSTWDYLHRPEEFVAWIDRAGRRAPLWNPPDVMRGNVHKFYLRELARRGVPIVPTEFLSRGAAVTLSDVMAARGWREVVVKPAVSAGSWGTLRVRADAGVEDLARGQSHLAALLGERDVLVQRYAPAVETSGERAIVWIDGEVTHSVRKSPRFLDQHESVSEAIEPAADERAFAERVLAPVREGLVYGRVDVVRDETGALQLMELELLEPSLFLRQWPAAMERLVAGVVRRLGG